MFDDNIVVAKYKEGARLWEIAEYTGLAPGYRSGGDGREEVGAGGKVSDGELEESLVENRIHHPKEKTDAPILFPKKDS
ncbi:MAG: hypothetical protein HYS23_01475 [Geobacter sp.]|nr:hypothetical protein [Geobacter sp.]